jgi:acetyl-CoA synthetase (ADP-forming)
MVGLGGIFVELFEDVSFRLCPIAREDAREMLDELRASAILDGARGSGAVSREAVVDVLMAVGGEGGLMALCDGQIAELDLNPLIVDAQGATAVDARVLLRKPSS